MTSPLTRRTAITASDQHDPSVYAGLRAAVELSEGRAVAELTARRRLLRGNAEVALHKLLGIVLRQHLLTTAETSGLLAMRLVHRRDATRVVGTRLQRRIVRQFGLSAREAFVELLGTRAMAVQTSPAPLALQHAEEDALRGDHDLLQPPDRYARVDIEATCRRFSRIGRENGACGR